MRRFLLVLVALPALLLPSLPHASADQSGDEAAFFRLTNDERSDVGLRRLVSKADLVAVARRWATRSAQNHSIDHNPNMGNEVQGWQSVGENVGKGPRVQDIHDAFMASPSHRDNIVDRLFTEVGMGVAYDERGTIYIVEVFREPETVNSPPPNQSPAPAPAPQPSAKPKPRPSARASATSAPRAPATQPAAPRPGAPVALAAAAFVAQPFALRLQAAYELREAIRNGAEPGIRGGAFTRAAVYLRVTAVLA